MAATDLERLVVQLSADIKKYENSLNRAMGVTNKNARAIESRFASMNKRISSGFGGLAGGAARAFALIGGAQGFKTLSDAATSIDNALKVAGLSGAELESVYQQLFASATKNAAPIETLVQLYSRLSLVQKELGVSQQQIVTFSDNIALALRVGGTSAQEASGALLQLSQTLGGGVVRAEEFNSILEGAPTILQAAAAGIKEADGSVAKLRQIMLDGNLSSKAFFDGFQAGAPILEDKVAGSVLTIDQRLGNLKTSLVNAAREFNQSAKAGETFGNEIDQVSAFVNSINFDNLITEIQQVVAQMNAAIRTANSFANSLGRLTGLNNVGKAIVGALPGDTVKSYLGGSLVIKQDDLITDRINEAFTETIDNAVRQTGDLTADAVKKSILGGGAATTTPTTGRLPPAPQVKPISVADYPVAASSSGGGGGGRKGRGGGGRSQDDYQREIEQIKERTAAIQAESAAQATVNPLIDDYGFASERASVAQDLLTAAQNSGLAAGKELTDVSQLLSGNFSNLSPAAQQQAQAMLDLANGYASASAEAERLAHQQDQVRERADDFKHLARDAIGGFISDLREGKSATEALANALDKVTEKLIDMALNSVFDGLFGGGGGGGFLGSLLGGGGGGFTPNTTLLGFLTNGHATGGPISGPGGPTSDDIPAMLSNGEYVINASATKKHRALLDAINSGSVEHFASGGLVGAPSLPRLGKRPSAGSPGVVVNITNNTSAQVKQQSRQTSSGPALDVVIDEAVADKINTPGSRSRGAMQGAFGLKGGLARR